jgi:hypothetical protein
MRTVQANFRLKKPVAALLFYLVCIPAAQAIEAVDCAAPEAGGSMTERTYNVLSRAMDDMGNSRFTEAADALQGLLGRVEGYERALVFQTLGHVQAQQDDMAGALRSFEESLATGALPRKSHVEMLLNTGQLHLAAGNHDQAIGVLNNYLATDCVEATPEVYMALASAQAQKPDYVAALDAVQQALGMVDVPEEAWLQFKLALHFELKQYSETAATLLDLIVLSPDNDQYWRQLSGVLLEIEKSDAALAVLAIAERQGFLQNERELRNLANLYLMLEIPYKAASLLERGLAAGAIEGSADNYEYLSEAWISAREWQQAETALSTAARLGDDGKLWQRLAQVRMENEDWPLALQAMQQALEAGVSDEGEAQYLLGIAAYNAGDMTLALQALRVASTKGPNAAEARQWLEFLQNEQRRLSRL